MTTKKEILKKSEKIEELFYDEYMAVSKISDELDLREKATGSVDMVEIGPPSWVLRVDCPDCDASGGFTKRKREQCDNNNLHKSRVEKAKEEDYAPDPLEEGLEGGAITEYIAFEILGFEDWDEYRRENKRLNNKERREEGFTDKKKRKVRERDGEQCVLCLSNDDLHVHHIDGDRTNNDTENLVTLCERCHNRIHSIQNSHSNRTVSDLVTELAEEGNSKQTVDAVISELGVRR